MMLRTSRGSRWLVPATSACGVLLWLAWAALENEPSEVQPWAAFSTGSLRQDAVAAIPALRKFTNDSRYFVGLRAREALREIEDASQ